MIRLVICVLALALTGLPTIPAAAQSATPALRASVTVTGDIVRIGDLVENAGAAADVPVFRAPDLGTTGAVATARIVEVIRPHQLIGIDTRGLSQVIVTRASRTITAPEIAARIARALAGQYGLGEAHNISVEFDREVRTLNVEPTATGELQVVALAYNPRTTRFDVTLDLPASAALRGQATRFTGAAIETIDAVTVERPVEHGEVLNASDLTLTRRPKSEGPAITDINAAAGLAARRQLRPGQPLHQTDLMKPTIVQRSDTVTIVYKAPGLTLTLRGQAQDAGALGDTINVLNVQSKRIVQGVVSGAGQVTVSAAPRRLVANTPEPAPAVPALPSDTTQTGHRASSTE
jgi:flagella basal body P-ring formation protein FlgA